MKKGLKQLPVPHDESHVLEPSQTVPDEEGIETCSTIAWIAPSIESSRRPSLMKKGLKHRMNLVRVWLR